MPKCTNCGAEAEANAAFCDKCGAPIQPGAAVSARPPKKRGSAAVIILSVFLTIFVVGSGFLGYEYVTVNNNIEAIQTKYPPHDFTSEAQLKSWLGQEIPKLDPKMDPVQQHYQLQTWALADGYVWSVSLRPDTSTVQSQVMVAGTLYWVKVTGEYGVLQASVPG